MKANGIRDVTKALQARLEHALASSGITGVVFVGPLDDPDASGASLILFLYRIAPNASLRNTEHRVPTGGTPPVELYKNSLPLDLYFLVTVGTTAGPSEADQLGPLGFVLQELQSEPELIGVAVGHETVRVSLEPLSTEEASRIWALFPTANYRTSIAYLATPVWIDPPRPDAIAARVIEDDRRAAQRPIPVAQ